MKKFLCWILGHNYTSIKEPYGTTKEGKPMYTIAYGKCKRCGISK